MTNIAYNSQFFLYVSLPLFSDSNNLCSFCCVESMEQEIEKQKVMVQETIIRRRYIKCRSCFKRFGSCCINGLFTYLTNHTALPQYIKDNDTSYLALAFMNKALISSGFTTIFRGPCCAFSQSIPEGTSNRTTNPPKPPTYHTNVADKSNEEDNTLTVRKVVQRLCSRKIRRLNGVRSEIAALDDLHDYHNIWNMSLPIHIERPKYILNQSNKIRSKCPV